MTIEAREALAAYKQNWSYIDDDGSEQVTAAAVFAALEEVLGWAGIHALETGGSTVRRAVEHIITKHVTVEAEERGVAR